MRGAPFARPLERRSLGFENRISSKILSREELHCSASEPGSRLRIVRDVFLSNKAGDCGRQAKSLVSALHPPRRASSQQRRGQDSMNAAMNASAWGRDRKAGLLLALLAVCALFVGPTAAKASPLS